LLDLPEPLESAPKYLNRRTWSEACARWFASGAEARRGEELRLEERARDIADLIYQPRYVRCPRPRVTYYADFACGRDGQSIVEEVTGPMTRVERVKRVWLETLGVEVRMLRRTGREWETVPLRVHGQCLEAEGETVEGCAGRESPDG
jgi:hypothetical protein